MASKPHASPLPPAVFPVTAAPQALAHTLLAWGAPSASRSLLFSSKASITCALAGKNPQARAVLGSGTGPRSRLQNGGAALHPGVPSCPLRPVWLPAAPFSAAGSRSSVEAVSAAGVSPGLGLSLRVLSWHTQHESSPKAKPRPCAGRGDAGGGRDVAAPLRLAGPTQSPCSPGLPPRL